MKIAFIILGFAASILMVMLVILFFIRRSNPPVTTPGTTSFPTSTSTPGNATNVPTTNPDTGTAGLRVATANGATMIVRDFTKDRDVYNDPQNQGQQYLGYHFSEDPADPSATDNPPYVIDYFTQGGYFNIVLYQEPLGSVRQQAQQDLMQRVGLNQAQMCNLKYSISAPYYVNQAYAGVNLLFSFCPGATVLP